jgi:hypothetical protein
MRALSLEFYTPRSAGDLVAGVLPSSDNPAGGIDPHRAFRRRRYARHTCTNCRLPCRFCTSRQWNSRLPMCAGRPAVPHGAQFAALDPRLQPSIAKEKTMLWTICIILLVLWALGMATSYTAGGLIHILLVIGLIVLVFRLIQGRRVLG